MTNRQAFLVSTAGALAACALALVCVCPPAMGQATAAQQAPWEAWKPPEVVLPQPNAFDTYLKAFAAKKQVDIAHGGPVQAQDVGAQPWWFDGLPDLTPAERLKVYAEVYRLARQALAQECRIPTPTTYEELCPYFADFRAMARLFAMEASVRAGGGDPAGAASSALDCIEMAQQVATSRWLLGFLVAAACEAIGERALDEVIPLLDAAACKEAARRLTAIEAKRAPLMDVMAGEETFCRRCFQELMAHPEEIEGFFNEKMSADARAALIDRLWAESWQAIDDYWANLQEQTARPYLDREDLPKPEDPFLRTTYPIDVTVVGVRDGVARAAVALRQAQLAARCFMLEKGRLPAGLDELLPEYMPEVPRDPFGGEALRSRADGSTLLIYSIGPDGRDDEAAAIEGRVEPGSVGDTVVKVELGPAG